MAPRPRLLAAALALLAPGCSWFWPRVVATNPTDPEVFRSGFPLVAGARTDGATAAENLDGFWHSFDTDAMQAYLRRILRGR